MSDHQAVRAQWLATENGIRFYRIHSEKFKTARTDVFYINPLSVDEVSANALVPALLRRGSEAYPSALAIERQLEALYGASFDWQVFKKGDAQVVHLGIGHVADRYASGGEPLFAQSAAMLTALLHRPLLVNGQFDQEMFEQERRNLVDQIRSRVNDKIRYAASRCVEEMFAGEPYAIHSEGDEATAASVTAEAVTRAWRRMVEHRPAFVYLSGDMPEADVRAWMEAFASTGRGKVDSLPLTDCGVPQRPVRSVDEPMDVNQGKLCMGLRTGVAPTDPDWPALLVYNGILGGDLHSKLFQNVREKAGLAYYASSRLERTKGLMFINSGIEAANRDKAQAIILEQMADMRNGLVTEKEHEATRLSLATAFKSAQDSQFGIVEFHLAQHLLGSDDTYDTLAEKVARVTIADVVRLAGQVRLDTIYFLKPSGVPEENPSAEDDGPGAGGEQSNPVEGAEA